jgi:hypothetical protein
MYKRWTSLDFLVLFFYLYIQYIGLSVTFCQMDVVDMKWIKWFEGLTCGFAGVFACVWVKKLWLRITRPD